MELTLLGVCDHENSHGGPVSRHAWHNAEGEFSCDQLLLCYSRLHRHVIVVKVLMVHYWSAVLLCHSERKTVEEKAVAESILAIALAERVNVCIGNAVTEGG